MFYNNKKYNSIVLLAIADANYELILVDVGVNGVNGLARNSQIWNTCDLKGHIFDHTSDFPGPSAVPSAYILYPHFIIANDAFALIDWMMNPHNRTITVWYVGGSPISPNTVTKWCFH